jgi:hypothetical protein
MEECFNQGQSKWQEVVESCVICTACTVIGKSKQGFQVGGSCGWHQKPEKTHRRLVRVAVRIILNIA